MWNIFEQPESAFGIDLSDVTLKIMQIEKKSKTSKLVGYTNCMIPQGFMVKSEIADETGMAKQIQNAIKKMQYGKVTTDRVIASIPESKAFVRVITIPKMTEQQAVSAVPFEAEQYIPIPVEQTYLDWQIISVKEETMDILVTACPREYVDSFLRLFKHADLKPVAFEVESAACARALISREKKNKGILILDMGTFHTSFIVVENGTLQFTSSVPIAGDAFTQSIAKALGISSADAEKTKNEFGLADGKEHQNVRAALEPIMDSLISEMRNIIKFQNEHSPLPVSEIMLSGGAAKLLNLNSFLYQKLADYDQADITLGNPWVNVFDPALKNPAPLTREDSLTFTTAIGLAIRGATGGNE